MTKLILTAVVAYYEQGNLEQAIEDFTRAMELDPDNDQAYYNRGLLIGNKAIWSKL